MAPRIVRPRRDTASLPLTLVGTAVCLTVGWFVGAWIFKPSTALVSEDTASEPDAPTPTPANATPTPRTTPVRDASVPAVLATVQVRPGLTSGCGDGEELSVAGPQCVVPPELEPALRERLTAVLATCPAAPRAAADPSKVLSIGLRVDFPRRRVVSLLGRSATVPDKVSYIPCVNNAMGPLDALWRLQPQHARYLFFFAARFSPLRNVAAPNAVPNTAPNAAPDTAPNTAPNAAPDTAPNAAPDTAPNAAPDTAPNPSLPTTADMQRMRVLDQATVTWSTAIVRDTPRSGPIVARLPQGTAVEIVDRRGSWYGIRWDRTHTGWTFGPAIGQ